MAPFARNIFAFDASMKSTTLQLYMQTKRSFISARHDSFLTGILLATTSTLHCENHKIISLTLCGIFYGENPSPLFHWQRITILLLLGSKIRCIRLNQCIYYIREIFPNWYPNATSSTLGVFFLISRFIMS